MEEILNELRNVYNIVSTIPVSGNHVESMTAVRIQLRDVIAQLSKDRGNETDGG